MQNIYSQQQNKISIIGQTIVEGGAVLQTLKGCFGSDTNENQQQLVVVKAMSVDIIYITDTQVHIATSIRINKAIELCAVIPADKVNYKTDLLFMLSSQLDVLIFSFHGTIDQLTYKNIKQFNLVEQISQDNRFQIPFQKKVQPASACFAISNTTRCVVFTYQETPLLFNQICFIAVKMNSELLFNVGLVKSFPQHLNISGLVTQIAIHQPLNKQYKGAPMLPQLGLFAMYLNKYITLDIEYNEFFIQFSDQVQYIFDGVSLNEGPFQLNNTADFSCIHAFEIKHQQEQLLFPLLIASIEKIQITHGQDSVLSVDLINYADVSLNPMSRPLSITNVGSMQNGQFLVSYDDGNILYIIFDPNEMQLQIKTIKRPILQNKARKRMPTATQIICLQYQKQQNDSFHYYIYIGSQSVDSDIYELINGEISIIKNKFHNCIGAVQDFSLYHNNRMLISTSHGRDGSVYCSRFGFQFEALNCVPVEQSSLSLTVNNKLDERIINSYIEYIHPKENNIDIEVKQYIIISEPSKNQSKVYQFDMQSQQIVNITETPPFTEIFSNLSFKLIVKIFDKYLVKVTSDYIQVDNQNKNMYQIIQVQQCYDYILILDASFKFFLFQIQQETGELIQIANYQGDKTVRFSYFIFQEQLYVMLANCKKLQLIVLENQKLVAKASCVLQMNISSLACLLQNNNLYIVSAAGSDVYETSTNLKLENPKTVQIFSRNCQNFVFMYQQYIFIKSQNSINKYDRSLERTFVLPILTQPLNNIFTCWPVENLQELEIYQEKAAEKQQMSMFRTSTSIIKKQRENYLPFNFALISDEIINTQSSVVEFTVAYNEEAAQLQKTNDFLSIAKPNTFPKYSMKRQLIKRTPVRIIQNRNKKVAAILTEQYIGKSQVRFYTDNHYHQKEFDKILPPESICTEMKFLNIQGEDYFVCALFNVPDIYKQLKQLNTSTSYRQPSADASQVLNSRLEVYQLEKGDQKKVTLKMTFHFEQDSPVTTFVQDTDSIMCCIGNNIVVLENKLPLQIKQVHQFDSQLEHLLLLKDQLIGVKTGQLFQMDKQFKIIKEQKEFLDVKLLQKFTNNVIFCLTYDNMVGVFDLELNLLCSIPLNQNITCAKDQNGKVFLGTDTGALVVLAIEDIGFLEFLQGEIENQFEDMDQKIFVQKMTNAVDGDIIKQYLSMSIQNQESIASRLNQSRSIVLEKLLNMYMKLAE